MACGVLYRVVEMAWNVLYRAEMAHDKCKK